MAGSDGFWADDDSADKREPTPMQGFASGGLLGLLHGLQAMGETDEGVDDPEALRRAEEAVAHDRPIAVGAGAPIDGSWAPVARQTGAGGEVALQEIARALESEGVTVGWDPFEPSAAVGFTPPGASRRPYAIQVPASEFDVARTVLRVLTGAPPQGVAYAWEPGPGQRVERAAEGPGGPESGFRTDSDARPAPAVASPLLSDNDRMARLASGRGSGAGVAIVAVCALLLGIAALAAFLRG
jgi:hypothetical protein